MSDSPPLPSNGHRRWYRSLYWRIAAGLFAFLALLLIAQSALFVWMIDRTAGSMPARSPRRLAVLVASDVAGALDADPALDLHRYLRDQFGHVFQPFVIVMRDGSVLSNHAEVPEQLREAIAVESERLQSFSGREGREGRGNRPGPPTTGTASLPPERPWETAPVFVEGRQVGRVAVLRRAPMSLIARELGPAMLTVGVGVLSIGMTLIALVVFGPARRRLQAVQVAAERLGTGDLAARAPEHGGDEVSSVARSFNRMAEELANRAQALDASDRARRQLLADVSHELMTPLTAMRGYVETLKMPEVNLDAATRDRYLGIIDDETHRLERIIGDLLDLARLEGGGGDLRRETVSTAALFDRVRARHEHETSARGITVVTNVEPTAAQIHGDPDRLEQALQNLAANGLRHTPDSGTMTLSATATADAVIVQVRDNGSGIPEEHLPLIFDRFYKVDSSRRAAGGSGLGLSIVKAIVERHAGTITARNDGGAVFEIRLPRPATP